MYFPTPVPLSPPISTLFSRRRPLWRQVERRRARNSPLCASSEMSEHWPASAFCPRGRRSVKGGGQGTTLCHGVDSNRD